ncbi:MAG: DUF2330 domain-containing protein [Actinomycetota bacterium]
MRRSLVCGCVLASAVLLGAAPALACGGLVAPNGSVNLLRTSTLAAYHDGIEHYVTSFEFAGGGAEFGSIVPLPGVPTRVRRGGDWTLQRLVQEVTPPAPEFFALESGVAADASKAEVLYETRIDGLDITILKGGGFAVGRWAKNHGFSLSPDAPEVLDFYADRSPIFMAASFDPSAAARKGFTTGDGVPIHLTIPTENPWVPLRILGLGKNAKERIEADVFLLTDVEPAMLPEPVSPVFSRGMILERSEAASRSLLADLRSDKGMKWLPAEDMWLTYLNIDTAAGKLTHDLAVDVSGAGAPSPVAAGLVSDFNPQPPREKQAGLWPWVAAALLGVAVVPLTGRLVMPSK